MSLSWKALEIAIEQIGLSTIACDRLLKVSRTVADLEGAEQIETAHLLEALNLRNQAVSNGGG